jgi:hypothetical protein
VSCRGRQECARKPGQFIGTADDLYQFRPIGMIFQMRFEVDRVECVASIV